MAKTQPITPAGRTDYWRKMWSSPDQLDADATEVAFDAFCDALVPRHMHRQFLKLFGIPKAAFGNRFFTDAAEFRDWRTRIAQLLPQPDTHVTATVIYGSPDALEAHRFRGQTRRNLHELFVNDQTAACAILESDGFRIYAFIEPKMRGCITVSERAPNVEPD